MPRDVSEMTEVKGLKELQQTLRRANPEMAKQLQQVNKALVQDVADEAKTKIYPAHTNRHGPSGHSRVAASIRGTASGREARVVAGGPKAPTFYGVEFGGGARPSTRQFPPHRGRQGYWLYPTVRRRRKDAEKDWNELFDRVFDGREGPL